MTRATKRLGLALCMGVAGCFPPPHLKADVTDATTPAGDTSGATHTASSDVDADVPNTCTGDEQCAGLAVAPCVVGRCEAGKCIAAHVAVTCDDGDVCTTADRCGAGVCKGRAFTTEEAKNWALVLTPTGPDDALLYLSDVAVHPSGEVSVVGTLRGLLELDHGRRLETFEEEPVYFRLSASGTILEADHLQLSQGGETVTAHTVVVDGEDAVVVGAIDNPSDGDLLTSVVQRLKHDGGVRWTTPPIAGAILRTLAAGSDELFVVSTFLEDVSLPLVAGGTSSFRPAGRSDLYVARVMSDGTAAWGKSWGTVAADVGPALIPVGGALLIGLGAFADANDPLPGGHFDGVLVPPDRVPALFKVFEDGAPSSLSSIPGLPGALLLGGFPVPGGDVIATMLAPGQNRASADSSPVVVLGRFFPDGAAMRWSVTFSTPPSAVFPGPVALSLSKDKTLVVWPLTQAVAAIGGWPVAIPAGDTNTLFGVWSDSGVLAGSWSLPGFVGTGAVPKEAFGASLGRETVSVGEDGGIFLVTVSSGAPLGADFEGTDTTAKSGVLVHYAPAHVFGCSAQP